MFLLFESPPFRWWTKSMWQLGWKKTLGAGNWILSHSLSFSCHGLQVSRNHLFFRVEKGIYNLLLMYNIWQTSGYAFIISQQKQPYTHANGEPIHPSTVWHVWPTLIGNTSCNPSGNHTTVGLERVKEFGRTGRHQTPPDSSSSRLIFCSTRLGDQIEYGT